MTDEKGVLEVLFTDDMAQGHVFVAPLRCTGTYEHDLASK